MKLFKRLILAFFSVMAFSAGNMDNSLAADRALLIGVGKYQESRYDLPGIDLDIGIMKEVVESLGFSAGNIKVLRDQEASRDNVRRTMESWLVNGTGPSDRVLIYYSGHGSQIPDENGDEDDGADEVLTMYDLAVTRRNGKAALDGVLVDDDFNRILNQIRSRNVLVLLDACHSGTATKSISFNTRSLGVGDGMSKFFEYEGMPLTNRSFKVERRESSSGGNYVAISAAADNEKSIATRRGSVFTLGIKDAVVSGKGEGARSLTPRQLWQVANDFVARNLPAERRFHPQINGSETQMDQPMVMAATSEGHGPVWRKVEQLADGSGGVRIHSDKQAFYAGQTLTMRIQIPEAGHLNIVSVGPDDVATVLFPNKEHPENHVAAGMIDMPGGDMPFDIIAEPPFGSTLVVAVVSEKPVNLFQSADANRDSKGNVLDKLGRLSEDGLSSLLDAKAFGVRKHALYKAGKLEARTCQDALSCK